ncbi:MAG: hypothetical protein EAZ97_15170 [Bacteroidetes bacterium]|nr:MAG: hypothetical protein EAZ97_15170 [Bacteroidota bacterium]
MSDLSNNFLKQLIKKIFLTVIQKRQLQARPETELQPNSENSNRLNNLISSAISVFFITLFLIFLYLNNKSLWNQKLKASLEVIDNLRNQQAYIDEKIADSVNPNAVKKQVFDPKQVHIFGLIWDINKQLNPESLALQFNISDISAIKEHEVDGKRGFLVPVKAVHWVKNQETAWSIGSKYYLNSQDSKLIEEFNGKIQTGKTIFIPFSKN